MDRVSPAPFRDARFLTGAHTLAQLPPDTGYEVAFAGRSNVGKSSAINALLGRRNLARTSKTPGRTQQINLFALGDDSHRLVDLPGYGYARVSASLRRHWGRTMEAYLGTRRSLRGLVLIMDCRHPLRAFDRQMLDWCRATGMAVRVLLTKADKLSRNRAAAALGEVRRSLERDYPGAEVQLFSAATRQGYEALEDKLCEWLALPGVKAKKSPGSQGMGVVSGANRGSG